MLVAVTRLRVRSFRYLLAFAYYAGRSRRQAERTSGCLGVRVRKTRGLAFWTLTFWDSEASMRRYMAQHPHRAAMPKLSRWCDEAAVAHWVHDSSEGPDWHYAEGYLSRHGRLSRVLHPSELQMKGIVSVA